MTPSSGRLRAGAEIRGDVLVALARLRLATPQQLRGLLLEHQEGTDYVRRALRNLAAERPPLVGRVQLAQQSIWFAATAGLAEAAASGLLPVFNGSAGGGRTTGRKAAAKTGLREHGLALVDAVLAFHRAEAADAGDWQIEPAHPTPAGPLIPDAVVLLASGGFAFVELDRGTMSYARVLAKLDRYAAYRIAPPSGRGNAARAPRSHWQEHYAGPYLEQPFPRLLVVFVPAPRRAAPDTREAEFLARAVGLLPVRHRRLVVATTTAARLARTARPGRCGGSPAPRKAVGAWTASPPRSDPRADLPAARRTTGGRPGPASLTSHAPPGGWFRRFALWPWWVARTVRGYGRRHRADR